MRPLILLLVLPSLLSGQSAHPDSEPSIGYRGFALAAPYADFTARARTLLAPQSAPLICNTSRRTAQLMECGALIRDPADSAGFYLAAYLLEGQVAFLSFGDSGGPTLVDRIQHDLKTRFGPARGFKAGMWEWRSGPQHVRLTWRGLGAARWIYISLWDETVMNRIAGYVQHRSH